PTEIEAIYRESHALWGAGLSYSDYVEFWADVRETGWARDHYRHLVWADGRGGILSSLKVYRPEVRLGRRRVRAAGIGAVFTPVRHRRKGHAAAMLRAVVQGGRLRHPLHRYRHRVLRAPGIPGPPRVRVLGPPPRPAARGPRPLPAVHGR